MAPPALALLAAGLSWAWGLSPAALRQAGYFELLDYYDPAVAVRIPAFDARLRGAAERAAAGALDADSALLLVYAGLYIANTDYGLLYGRIPLTALPNPLSPERTVKAEVASRESLALGYFERAKAVFKEDKRIDGWLAGARIRLEAVRDGRPSAAAVEQLLAAAEAYPRFNLFSGLILSNEHPLGPEADRRLFELVKLMTSGHGPCDEPGAECGSSELAAYADQGAALLMADAYLKQGSAILSDRSKKNLREGYHDTGMALLLYTAPYLKGVFKTRAWPQRPALGERLEKARAFMRSTDKKPLEADLFSGPKARAAYQCAACHSRKTSMFPDF